MHPTLILLVFTVCNSAALFYGTNDVLTVFASNNSTFNHTNASNNTTAKNTSLYNANINCTDFHSLSCRLPSCDIKPMQQGCPLQATKANSTSAYNTLRQLQKH
jgi:hypothetical protein